MNNKTAAAMFFTATGSFVIYVLCIAWITAGETLTMDQKSLVVFLGTLFVALPTLISYLLGDQ